MEDVARNDLAFAPTATPELLAGKWYLDFCDAADVLSLGLLPLPLGSRIGDVYQSIEAIGEGSFEVQNGVNLTPPPLPLLSDAPPLGGTLPDAVFTAVQSAFADRVYLETTYL